jgi:predicted amidohydrolase
MQRRAQPEKIRACLRAKGMPYPGASDRSGQTILRAAVVQEQIQVLPTMPAYADRMHVFVQQAAAQGAQLVCFPEENGLLLLGQLPLIHWILRWVARQAAAPAASPAAAQPTKKAAPLPIIGFPDTGATAANGFVAHLLSFFSPFFVDAFTATFSELARGYGVYIMAGSAMIVEDGRLYNRAYLFGPDGALMGTQNKAHPVEMEIDLQMSTAHELKVFDTALAKLAFPVCMDATYFETFKILKQQGAELVIIPIANLEPYEEYFALRGIWPRVQESGLYGLKSALVGTLAGLEFTGKAGLYAPLDLTSDRSGVIAEAHTYDQDEVVCADLDLARLKQYTSPYFSDTNPALYQKYFPDLYQQ